MCALCFLYHCDFESLSSGNYYEDSNLLCISFRVFLGRYVSFAIGCPVDGLISPSKDTSVANKLHDMGCFEIFHGDTIGITTQGNILNYVLHQN